MHLADWRNLAIIILGVQVFIMVIVVGAVVYLTNRGVLKAQQALQHYAPIAQDRLRQLAVISQQVSEKLATPIINAEAAGATARRWRTIFQTSFRS